MSSNSKPSARGSAGGATGKNEKADGATDKSDKPEKASKKKKRVVNEAQSQVMDESTVRFYYDQLLMRYITQSELKTEYTSEIPEDKLSDYFIRLRRELDRSYGNPDIMKSFFETKAWLETEQWKNESVQFKEQQYRDRVFGTQTTFDPNTYDSLEEDQE